LEQAGSDGEIRRIETPAGSAEILGRLTQKERLTYEVQSMDPAKRNLIGLVITRLDNAESIDPQGAYRIVLRPGPPVE
jgi:hypothetical protein